jgi:hypothetical protein
MAAARCGNSAEEKVQSVSLKQLQVEEGKKHLSGIALFDFLIGVNVAAFQLLFGRESVCACPCLFSSPLVCR